MKIAQIQRLKVFLDHYGRTQCVGELALSSRKIYFEYDKAFLEQGFWYRFPKTMMTYSLLDTRLSKPLAILLCKEEKKTFWTKPVFPLRYTALIDAMR